MSGKNTYKPSAVKGGSHIQMFLDSPDKHFIDAIRETTYNEMLLNGGRRHSEFMQPYLSTDYPGMDYLWPDMSLFGEIPGVNDALTRKTGGGGAAGAYDFQCIISCMSAVSGSMCDTIDPLGCFYGAITADGGIGGWGVADAPADFGGLTFKKGGGGTPVYAVPSKKWKQMSSETGYWVTISYNDVGSTSGGWYYHPLMDRWIYINPGKSTCYYTVFVSCPVCPPDVVMSFDDDSTPDTIAPGGNISVYVQDGLGPYTWNTTSMGYSMGSAVTSGVANSLNCVAGSCGVDYDPYATVTVVDECMDSISFNIRNTGGQWVEKEEIVATMSGTGCVGYFNCTPATADMFSENIYKWTLLYLRCWAYSVGKTCESHWNGGANWPTCGDSMPCGAQYCATSCVSDASFNRFKMATRYQYYEWEC